MSDTGHLTIAQAVSEINASEAAPPEKVEAAPAEKPEEELEAVPAAEDASEPETATEGESEAEPEQEAAEGEEPQPKPIEPPRFWDAEAKKRFSELPPDLQAIVVARESERDKATAKALETASVRGKAHEAETSKLATLAAHLDQLVPNAEKMFQNRWKNVDWNKVVDDYGAEAALKLRNDFESEQQTVQQLQAAQSEVEQAQVKQFVSDRFEKLKTVAPELADSKAGAKRQMDLHNYLVGLGVPSKTIIERASAEELAIGYKAMLWDNAQKKAQTLAAAPKPAVPSRTAVRPTASVQHGAPQLAALKSLDAAFKRDPSMKNLTALEEARERLT